MKFQLNFDIEPSNTKIGLQSSIITIGSCFSDIVGNELITNKFNTLANPFGTVFNPDSIFKILNQSIFKNDIEPAHFVENDKQWFHYDYHSQNNSQSKKDLKKELATLQNNVLEKIQSADFLIITLGTAFAYQYLATKKYVANCHKMPSQLFRKDLLHVKHICQEFEYFYKNIKAINPTLNIILTVSPVRHTKDGIPENQVSKSILRTACHYLCTDFKEVSYFPAYEIMMDELRDYRFYESDLIHPNKQAEKYIFERFSKTYFDEKTQIFLDEWAKIKSDINHRPTNINSEKHQTFLKNILVKLDQISALVNVEKEKELVLSRIFV
jgi:hypothetical protein